MGCGEVKGRERVGIRLGRERERGKQTREKRETKQDAGKALTWHRQDTDTIRHDTTQTQTQHNTMHKDKARRKNKESKGK